METKIKTAESKPDIKNLATKSSVTAFKNKIPDVNGFVKKTGYSDEITNIKNDYVTKVVLDSKINDLKNTHISDEVKKVHDQVTKNSSDILGFENRLKQKEDTLNNLERAVQSFYGDQYYKNSWLIFKASYHSFDVVNSKYINCWRSKRIFDGNLDSVTNSSGNKPDIHIGGETVSVNLNGNYFKQPKVDYTRTAMAINIVYELNNKKIDNLDFIQANGLFGNCKLTITPTSKRHYGYTNGI